MKEEEQLQSIKNPSLVVNSMRNLDSMASSDYKIIKTDSVENTPKLGEKAFSFNNLNN